MVNTRNEIIDFISEFTGLPKSQLADEFDLVSDFDWASLHEDENLGVFLDDFIWKFKIYVPSQDFNRYLREKKCPLFLGFFLYPIYILKYREPLIVDRLTVKNLIDYGSSRVWTEQT